MHVHVLSFIELIFHITLKNNVSRLTSQDPNLSYSTSFAEHKQSTLTMMQAEILHIMAVCSVYDFCTVCSCYKPAIKLSLYRLGDKPLLWIQEIQHYTAMTTVCWRESGLWINLKEIHKNSLDQNKHLSPCMESYFKCAFFPSQFLIVQRI